MPDEATAQLPLPDRADLEDAARVVARTFTPTPQQEWPLLSQSLGSPVVVKHENHTPVGAFKVRGGLVYFDRLAREGRLPAGVVSATRGNHGQSIAYAARRHGVSVTIVVPHGNSREKNDAMRSLGATLVEYGDDFQESLEHAVGLADREGLHLVPSFHPWLVAGVATYAMELLSSAPDLEVVYVPIGLGSGATGMLAAKDALGHGVEVVGVVSAGAPAYARSMAVGEPVSAPVTTVLADGMACRTPNSDAFGLLQPRISRIIEVSDEEVAAAMRLLFRTTHNVAEGAGAASLAAAVQESSHHRGRRVGVVLSGGNVDSEVYAEQLAGAGR